MMMAEEDNDQEYSSDQFVQLRDAHKALKKEAKELRAFREAAEPQLRTYALKNAGFDPDSGPAKALLKIHEGEFTPEALKATAAEYGLAAGEVEGGSTATELTEEQKQAIASTERSQQLQGQASPEEPQTIDARIRAAEAKGAETGDWTEFDQLQVQASLSR